LDNVHFLALVKLEVIYMEVILLFQLVMIILKKRLKQKQKFLGYLVLNKWMWIVHVNIFF